VTEQAGAAIKNFILPPKHLKMTTQYSLHKLKATWGILLLLIPFLSFSQSPQELLEKGREYYSQDQLDSARLFYNQAYQQGSPDIQIQSIGGLISVSLLRSELAAADSLMAIGDQLMEKKDLGLEPLCYYLIRKGEYFRSSSQFQKALAQHQAVIRLSTELPASSLIYADALYYTALTFERLSEYDSSILYIDRAYDMYKQELDTTSVKFGNIYNGMGACYYRVNRYEEAKRFYLKSKEIAETQVGPVSTDLAMVLSNLSSISRAEEDYHQAIAYSEQALKIYRALDDEGGISGAYYSLGVYHYFLGDYGRTKDYLEACIEIRERLYNPNHYSLIGPYEVLGIAFEENGDYEKTLDYLKKARPIILHNFGPGSINEAFNYENTSICYKNIGQLDSALYYMQWSNQIIEPLLPENDYSMAVHYFNYANIHYLLNNFEQARFFLKKSATINQNLGLDNSSEQAQNLGLQALMLAEEKNWPRADQLFAKALTLVQLPESPQGQEMAFQLGPNSLWLLNEYSDYLYRKYKSTQQEEVLRQFEAYSKTYLELSDRFRQQFIDPYTKSILIKDNAEVYNRNIGIYNELYRQTSRPDYLNAAFNFAEYGRTCLLRDLQDDKIESYAGIPDSVLQKEVYLKKEISRLNQQLLNEPNAPDIKKALFETKEALNQHVQRTLQSNPRYYDLKFNSNMPTLEEVQAQMSEKEVLVEYMQDDTAIYALVIRPDFSELTYLANRSDIERAIKDWKSQIVRQAGTLQTSGAYLYQKLWQPLETHLTTEQITIIPVGALFYLNFETLPLGEESKRFLIHQYNISYALSINIHFSEDQQRKKGTVIAVAPGFEENIKQPYRQQLDSLERVDEEYLQTVRQPWSLRMVKKLERQFANQVYTGLKATESNIKESIQKGKVLLFGTHAIADSEDPLRSKLVLAKEIGEQKEDGYLHAYELYSIPLEAELAVLNACESGIGSLQAGEGMISLAYSIHYAGCPSTVMSLWKVDEKISTQITESFMQYLSKNYSKSEALRQAKLDYLESAEPILQHPFYWGGMVLMGKDGELEVKKNQNYWYWVLGVGLFLGIAFTYLKFRV
jgi:CHAT domain-containing protein